MVYDSPSFEPVIQLILHTYHNGRNDDVSESIQHYRPRHLLEPLSTGLNSSIVPEMLGQWYQDNSYSRSFLVPVIAGYFFYLLMEELKETGVVPSNQGLLVMFFALVR